MMSVSTRITYQEVREISPRSGKSQGRWKSKKVATLFDELSWKSDMLTSDLLMSAAKLAQTRDNFNLQK